MKRGEIWLVGLDPTQGHEQKGRRPVLIVSPEAFNRVTKVSVVLPITSGGNFARTAGFAVPLADAHARTRAKGPPSGPDRVAGGLQPGDESVRGSADNERWEFRTL